MSLTHFMRATQATHTLHNRQIQHTKDGVEQKGKKKIKTDGWNMSDTTPQTTTFLCILLIPANSVIPETAYLLTSCINHVHVVEGSEKGEEYFIRPSI